jgi:hypothetical protein
MDQGCQIFLGATYPNRKNIPKTGKMYPKQEKCTQNRKNVPKTGKIY